MIVRPNSPKLRSGILTVRNTRFFVEIFNADGGRVLKRTIELASTSRNHFTREELTDVPTSGARVRATVGEKTDEKDLIGYDKPVQLSIKYNNEDELEIVDYL
ncbi:hypothetical protein [Halorussus sp. MSC15.2]|uniref:hypothetical protein n=1 Tax=Halorussus sp. MSC15.2 TaxID=2283638 RepID=UPI0013CFE5A8|nr:hypothetical protein [Halorussus sp. MSC15.2]NEU58451.1 hypothetical protein [Halorussus sp. MSC15.2]